MPTERTASHDDDDPNDLSYAEALEVAQPRIEDVKASVTALLDQIAATWSEVEPGLRAWVADADRITEQGWMDAPETTRAWYDFWKRWFAEHDTPEPEGEDSQP